ncbi:MAG: helix-turn-helix domain-containing protein [Pirellulaceae bacterium]
MTVGPRSTSIRPLGKMLEAIGQPVYLVAADGRFDFFNAACALWLGADLAEQLLKWKPSATSPTSDPLDRVAERLCPPMTLRQGRPSTELVSEFNEASWRITAKEFLFVPLSSDAAGWTLAIGDAHWNSEIPTNEVDLISISRQLTAVRQRYPRLQHLGPLIGSSPQAEHLRQQVTLAADCQANVFLTGREGCGGLQIAQAIHKRQAEQHASLTPVDCSLMDAELLQAAISPLISRLAGSTHATGTVLLRHIDQLAADAQATLRQYMLEFDKRLRFICLSALTVRECLDRDCIQPSIALSLATLPIHVPALVDRISDLPMIVQHLIHRRTKPNQTIEGIARPALDLLSSYPWPGDFDELDGAIRHAVRETGSSVIQPQHLPLAIRSYRPQDPLAVAEDRPIDLDRFLLRIERELIDRAVEQSGGNRAEAARRLGISRSRLLRRLDEYDASAGAED